VLQYGTTERALAVKRGQERIFKRFDTLAVYLKQIGIETFKTDTKQFDPTVTHVKRTDTSERMRKAHEAAAHDAWFRAQVEHVLQEADDPNTQWVSNETVKATSREAHSCTFPGVIWPVEIALIRPARVAGFRRQSPQSPLEKPEGTQGHR
jgi:hypothetical protein